MLFPRKWRESLERALGGSRQVKLEQRVTRAAAGLVDSLANSVPFVKLEWRYTTGPGRQDVSLWFVFETGKELEQAFDSGLTQRIDTAFRDVLRNAGYPANALSSVFVGFRSRGE